MAVAVLAKGFTFAVALFLTCFFGTLVLLLPCVPVALRWPPLGRRLMDAFLWLWFVFAAASYELLLGVKVVVQGQPPPPDQSVLILCNHRTRLDWLFLVSYQLRCGALRNYRISLKKPLKYIPGPGWAMQCAGFLFLKREWRIDEGWITQALKYFAHMGTTPQFLLFPEGTDFCKDGLAKSHKFAKANNLPEYQYVLHPRTTGFIHFINQMKTNKTLDYVVDVTVAYPHNIVHGENHLVRGRAPREVRFLTRSHPISQLPQSNDKLEAWCRDLWQEKERRLEKFYNSGEGEEGGEKGEEEKMFCLLDGESPDILSPSVSEAVEAWVQRLLWGVVVFWAVFMSGVVYALVCYPLFKWYCLLSALTFVFIGKTYGGVDNLLYATCA